MPSLGISGPSFGRALVVVSLLTLLSAKPAQDDPGDRTPVIVELFTSEGCSSCPPADRFLSELHRNQPVQGVEVIALSEHVDYWDRLGWKDPFSDAQFTSRQRHYGNLFRSDQVYTPQMVVDGRAEFVGSDRARARAEIVRAADRPKGKLVLEEAVPSAKASGKERLVRLRVRLLELPEWMTKRAALMLAITQDALESNVTRGENRGRRLPHDAVVRRLERVSTLKLPLDGTATREATLEIPADWSLQSLRAVAFVEDSQGRIAAAASVPLGK